MEAPESGSLGVGKVMRLAELGERICIMGPSGSGKSTLASAIARKQGLEVIHLDQLYHLPNTDWQMRPTTEFIALHDEAIAGSRWVMDGNYSKCLPQRMERATGVILLDVSIATSLFRYMRRSLFERARAGGLAGGQDSIKMAMIHHIVAVSPKNRRRYAQVHRELRIPKLYLGSRRAVASRYREWELEDKPRISAA